MLLGAAGCCSTAVAVLGGGGVGEEEGGGLWMGFGWMVLGGCGWWWCFCAAVVHVEARVEEVEGGASVV